jgi:hypothetical protein
MDDDNCRYARKCYYDKATFQRKTIDRIFKAVRRRATGLQRELKTLYGLTKSETRLDHTVVVKLDAFCGKRHTTTLSHAYGYRFEAAGKRIRM